MLLTIVLVISAAVLAVVLRVFAEDGPDNMVVHESGDEPDRGDAEIRPAA